MPAAAVWIYSFFFFQAEDGIRVVAVTGVQTCALPIYPTRAAGGYVTTFERHHVTAAGARGIDLALELGDVLGCLTVARRRDQILKDAGRADDMRLLRMRERNLNHFDAEQRRVRRRIERSHRATGQLVGRAHGGRAGNVDVDVVGITGLRHNGMRVRAATRLHVGDVPRIGEIGGVEDADAAQPVMAHRIRHALRSAVGPAVQRLARDEQEVAIDGDVALRSGTDEGFVQPRNLRVRDVPDLDAVEITLNDVVAAHREIGVDEAEIARRIAIDEVGRGRRCRDQSHIPVRLAGSKPSGAEPDARILALRGRRGLCRGASPYDKRKSEY